MIRFAKSTGTKVDLPVTGWQIGTRISFGQDSNAMSEGRPYGGRWRTLVDVHFPDT